MENRLKNPLRRQDASSLAQGYSPTIRVVELAGIVTFTALEAALVWRLWGTPHHTPWLLLSALLLGYLVADFTSGFIHWLGDTWGSTELPVIGRAFISPFREHHVDQKSITRHDFVETNGNNCIFAIPAALLAVALPHSSPGWVFASAFLGSMMLWMMATNQFHKWSHLDEPPALVRFLQRVHLILPPEHHQFHHTPPFNTSYCITTGWMNKPLTRLGFFPALERLTTRLTGRIPRQDDLGAEAAQELFEATQVEDHEPVSPVRPS